MKEFKAYLAGKMSGLSFEEMNEWRLKAKEEFKYQNRDKDIKLNIFNPCDYYNFNLNAETYTEKEVKKFDLYHVKSSNVVLINLDYPDSIGSAIEIHMAHDEWRIPVIAFGKTKNHPWIMESVDKFCNNLEEAVEYISDFYI